MKEENKKAIETMCRRCSNHGECGGTGCHPKKLIIEALEELEKTQKAFEIACDEFSNYGECLDFPMCTKCFYDSEKEGECSEEFKNYFLKKAEEAQE